MYGYTRFCLRIWPKKVLEEAAYGLEKPSDWKRTCDVLKCCLLRQLIRFWNRAIMYRRPQVFPTTAKFIISAHVSSSICPSFTGTRPARGHRLSCMLQAVFSSLGLRRWDQPKIRAGFVRGHSAGNHLEEMQTGEWSYCTLVRLIERFLQQ